MATSIENGTETFTFEESMIEKISSAIVTEIDENVLPQSGPLSNIGVDSNGVIKTIIVTGRLYDAKNGSVVSVQNIQSMEIMKLWLEALENGNQVVRIFVSNREKFSVIGVGTSVITDTVSSESITLQAAFGVTTVYVKSIDFDDEEGNPETIPFIMTLWVAGT